MRAFARRRSCLTVPGGSDKMVRKAAGLAADEIVLDLEDGVAPDGKDAARRLVLDVIGEGFFGTRQIAVRVNAQGSPWHDDDLRALGPLAAKGVSVVLPKVDSAEDVRRVEDRFAGDIQALIETALGLARCLEIAGASEQMASLIIGYGDLASALGRSKDADWNFVQETVLLAARVQGLQAIDGPCFDLTPGSGRLVAEAATTSAKGFDGKWAIHPAQIEAINAAFTPSAEAVSQARGILAALDAATAAGKGVAVYEGAMIDEAMRRGALRIVAKVEGAA